MYQVLLTDNHHDREPGEAYVADGQGRKHTPEMIFRRTRDGVSTVTTSDKLEFSVSKIPSYVVMRGVFYEKKGE